ncbi:peptidylprolyl isomerase, partial [Vibrio alfacsensis]
VKGEQAAMELGVQLVNELKEGKQDTLQANNLSFGELESIDRSSPLAGTVFAMTKPAENAATYAQTKDMEGNIVVVELTKVASEYNEAY